MTENKIKWIYIFNALLVVMTLILVIVGVSAANQFKGMDKSYGRHSSVEEVSDGWMMLDEDGSFHDFTAFGHSSGTKDLTLSRIFIFDEDVCRDSIGFVVGNCAVEVYQDGVLVFQYGDADLARSGVLLGNCYCSIPLLYFPNSATEVDIHFVSDVDIKVDRVFFGSSDDIAARRFLGSMNTLIFAIEVFIVSFVLFVVFIFSRKQIEDNFFYYFFLLFLVLVCIWAITDTYLLSVLGIHPGVLCLISYESFMMIGIPFMIFIYYSYKRMKVFDLVAVALMFLNFVMNNILHFSGVASFVSTNFISQIILISGAILVLVQSVVEYITEKDRKALSMIVGFSLLLVLIIVQMFYFYFVSPFESLRFVEVGVILFVMMQVAAMMYSIFEYVKEGHKAEGYLYMARTDALTGLGNRRGLDLYISEMAGKNSGSYRVGCIVCDLNDLKLTNDVHGHIEGDKLLKDFANCLTVCFDNRGIPFRTGGDEFCIMFSDVEVDMSAMMRRLEIGIEGTVPSGEYKISCSSGCYADYVPGGNTSAVWDIIKMADDEMYKVKKADRLRRSRS